MKLWTIQPVEIISILETDGVFRCNPSFSTANEYESFKIAYNWLVMQMGQRIGAGVGYPIWAWHTWDWKRKKPDLRSSSFEKRGTPLVCIEINISDNRVLLSDFDAWHGVLNNRYIDSSIDEASYDEIQKWYAGLDSNTQRIEKLKSWESVFDTSVYIDNNNWKVNGKFIQATFWELYKDDIVNIQRFIAR